MLPVPWGHKSDGNISACQLLDALVESLVEPSQQGCSSSNDDGVVEGLPHIYVTFLDRVDDHFVHARPLEAYLVGTEQDLGCLELL